MFYAIIESLKKKISPSAPPSRSRASNPALRLRLPARYRAIATSIVLFLCASVYGQKNSNVALIGLRAEVRHILNLKPASRIIANQPWRANIHNTAENSLALQVEVEGTGQVTTLLVPIVITSNVRGFTIQATSPIAIDGFIRLAPTAEERSAPRIISRSFSLKGNPTFAMATTPSGRVMGTFPATVEIQLASVPAGEKRRYWLSLDLKEMGR